MTHWIENIMYGMGLKQKLMLFIVAIIVFFMVLNVFILRRDYVILSNYSEDNLNYSRISQLQTTLADNNRYLNAYFNEASPKSSGGYTDVTLEILSTFNETGYEIFNILDAIEASVKSQEEYLWVQSIHNAGLNYRDEANKAIREHNNGITDHQDEVNHMYAYIDVYINQLLKRTAETREGEYAKLFREWNQSKNMTVLLLAIITVILYMSGTLFSDYLTGNIRQIISLHDSIGEGDFLQDISGHVGEDEVGQLNQSLQDMQRNIKAQIDTLNEKAVMQQRLYEEELRNIDMKRRLDETKYAMLQSQINPHFLFNTLNIISRKAMFNDSEEAVKLIKALSELFRHSLIDVSEKVSIEQELTVVQEYLFIQKSRFGPRLSLSFQNHLVSNSVLIPPLIIQPIVENAIVHGIEPQEDGGHLEILVTQDKDSIWVTVSDDGPGIQGAVLEKLYKQSKEGQGKRGIGLMNVKERMEYFSGKDSFIINSSNKGTSIALRFNRR